MFTPRVFIAFSLCLVAGLLALSSVYGGNRAKTNSISSPSQIEVAIPIAFSGTYDPHVFPCSTPKNVFTVLPGQVRIIVQVSATIPSNDLTVTLLYGSGANPTVVSGPEDTGTSSELLLYQPAGGVPAGTYQVQVCETPNPGAVPQVAPFDYNGTFTTDDTGPAGGLPIAKLSAIPTPPPDTGAKIGFENFSAPGVLIPVKTTEAGQQPNSVEYMGRNAGEPSIGSNWLTDTAIFYSGLETLFVKFDDSCPLSGLSSSWVNRAAPTQIAADSDPIGFTDSPLGRSFANELTLLSPTSKMSLTDNDGQLWVPTQGSGFASGVDHQTVGGGIYHAPIPSLPTPYNHAVYYCSQEGEPGSGPPSFCSRSDDGGITFGPSISVTTPPINVCGGLHGHVKVSPKDGTVFLPFNTCDGVGSVVVSEDNGITWTVRHVQTAAGAVNPSASFQDPAVSIDANGRVYYAIADRDTAAAVLTSDNNGQTWQNLSNVSDFYGLKNIRYPAATAGDAGRAAISFLGTITPGDALQPDFKGVWHLYVASTFDGGVHWSTTDVTPNAPMQRGCIWAKGGANICRNLLDFYDMTVDKDGRILIGYVNGCEGGNCVQAPIVSGETPLNQGNGYTSTATIARQSSGRRLFASKDPAGTTSKPGMPSLTQRRNGNVVSLQWSEADTGNLMINSYQIWRGTAPGAEAFLTSVAGSQTGGTYTDVLAGNDTQTYYYKVLAVNTAGTSCGNNEVAAPYLGTTCNGLVIHRNDPAHPEANAQTATPASLLIDYVAVGEPPGTNQLLFKMKVNSLATLPPNSRWRIVWDSFFAQTVGADDAAQQFYIGMNTDASSTPSFEWGTLADAGVPAVFVISETKQGVPDSATFSSDGTITMTLSKSLIGNPAVGALLGAVNGRTITGDDPNNPVRAERSNAFVDHTFVKAQTDNSYPASTYLVTGNTSCLSSGIPVIGAVSRMTHTGVGDFDVDLPLSGNVGVESRRYTGANAGRYKIVVTFLVPVQVNGAVKATLTAPQGGSVDAVTVNNSVVTVDLKDVQNQQTIILTLNSVSDGTNTANVSIPMGVLLGDVDGNKRVDGNDVSAVQGHTRQIPNGTNFRTDVNTSGRIDGNDVSTTQSHTREGL